MMKRYYKLFLYLILIVLISFTLTSCTVQSLPPTVIEEIYLGVPVIKSEGENWCLPASVQSVLNYAVMNITQEEIAPYVINENGLGSTSLLVQNAEKLGIDAYRKYRTLEEIKEEINKERPPIVWLVYSLILPLNHFFVINGYSDIKNEISLMCPSRGYIDISYDEFKNLNDIAWEEESDLYKTTSVWPKDESIKNSKFYREKTIQIISE